MNHFQTTGILVSIKLPNDEDARKGRSGQLVVRYGGRRDRRGGSARQYVNAVPLRVPSKLVKNFREFQVGDMIEIMGRLEGVLEKSVNGQQYHSPQLVANVGKHVDMSDFGFKLLPVASEHPDKPPVEAAPLPDEDPEDEGSHVAEAVAG